MTERKLIFKVTAKDVRWDYYNGQGKGGQNRNKRANCVRCTHEPSGAVGKAEDERDLPQNKRLAFERMARTKEMQAWLKLEAMRRAGELKVIEDKVDRELLLNTKVEALGDDGKWRDAPELAVTEWDVRNTKD